MARRIGFLVDQRLVRDGDGVRAETPFVGFLTAFRRHFDEVVLISRLFDPPAVTRAPYPIDSDRVVVVPLPQYPRIADLYLHRGRYWPGIKRTLHDSIPTLDALWLNFGHPTSLYALRLSRALPNLRCFAVLRGAYERDARLRATGPAAGWIAGALMRRNMNRFTRLARNAGVPCFAYGEELVRRLQRRGLDARPFVDSLLSTSDVEAPPDRDPRLKTDLLFVGRLTPEKGLDLLLEALAPLRAAGGSPATLRVVGNGPKEEEYRSLVRQLGLDDRVDFDGHVPFGPDLFRRYRSATVLVMPSRTEGLPKTAYEAMAFGCPVIACAVGGLPEVLGNDEDRGRLVPPGDAPALRQAVQEALSDPDGVRRMAAGHALARGITIEARVDALVNDADLRR